MAKTKKVVTGVEGIDPTTYSVVWNKLQYLTQQVGEKVLYSTQSFVTALVKDLGVSILNTDGKIVTAARFAPVHTLVAEEAIKGLESIFHGDYRPGDFIIANDPYIVAGGHLPDWNFIRPMFYRDELIGFFQGKTHVSDTGGFLPGGYGPGAYDVIAEGLNIPPLKLLKEDVLQKEIWDLILRNVRAPTELDMDTRLINGCMAGAEKQVVAMCDKYGVETIKACMNSMVSVGEKAMREAIAEIPDGTYHGESATDWDGKDDKPIWVRVKVTVEGDEVTFDYSESDPQVTFINCPKGVTVTNTMVAMFFFVDPSVPKNGGAMNPVHIVTRKGTVVDPNYPATVGASQVTVGTQITEACMLALGQAIPDRAMAGWSRHLCPINIGVEAEKIDPRTGHARQYFTESFGSDGGSGGVKGFDGWQGAAWQGTVGCLVRPNIEFFENSSPYLVTHYEVLEDMEGAGEFRGAPGSHVTFIARTSPKDLAFLMTGNSDGEIISPPGVAGGQAAPLATMEIASVDGDKRILRTFANEPIRPGEICITRNSGGGGWGDPLNRDVGRVRDDVMNGLVSLQRAKDVYGVVIDSESFEVDEMATEQLRSELRQSQEPR